MGSLSRLALEGEADLDTDRKDPLLHHEFNCPFPPAKIKEISAQCGGNCTIADNSGRVYRIENGVCTVLEDLMQQHPARNRQKLDQLEGTAS